jgi:hypothetical protein
VARQRTASGIGSAPRDRPLATAQPSACPEIDCVRDLLPSRVVAAAERRARAIGLGADRVLICADAMTEDAYLTVLAASLGTSYEPLDRISRADCPLDDDQLVQGRRHWIVRFAHSIIRPRNST